MVKNISCAIMLLFFFNLVNAQIDDDFYQSRYNVSLVYSKIKADNISQSSKVHFISVNLFDFTLGGSEKFKSYFNGNMRVIGDIWWMLAKEIGGTTDYLNGGYTSSVFELKWGLNIVSNDKILITPGLASDGYWYVFNGQRAFTWCLGPLLKVDYLLTDNLLIRNLSGFDFPFARTNGSLGDKSSYLYNRTELITKVGFFVGFDYMHMKFIAENEAIPESKLNRFDFKLGYMIRM
ncbi:MAG: hypothetical protein IPM74_03195 [Crocinitomicaceae bacterium]|nr:hypothetical protein [Crocinitomicaceae bacterium]MBK8924922.1 hypothetical protein [Crocinitomicaceae bacterium]